MKPCTSFRRLATFLRVCLLLVLPSASVSSFAVLARSMPCRTRTDRFRAHLGREGFAVLFLGFAIFGLAQKLAGQQRGFARIDHEVILIIDDALELAGGHVHDQAESARHALEEPDVRDGNGELDVAHAFAADAREGDFHAATIADDALVLDPFVFAARAFPVLRRTENAFAKETALLRLEGTIVDRFRVLDFAFAPGTNGVRGRDGDADLVETDRATEAQHFAG